jgi:hypothetical protein
MRNLQIVCAVALFCFATGCSPRDYLTRRLAADLIASSDTFRNTQQFWLRTGIISNKDYLSPEYMVLQRRGWITGVNVACPPTVAPPPCWDVALTPLGVETFRDLVPSNAAVAKYFPVTAARRELISVTGIMKNGRVADVDFHWKWVPANEVGAALYPGGIQFSSSVVFKHYDDGWRLIEGNAPKTNQSLDEALKDAQPAQ